MRGFWIALMVVFAAGAIGALLNQSVGWTTQSPGAPLAGTWTCKVHVEDFDIQMEMDIRREGALDTTIWLRGRKEGHSIAAKMTSEDSWRMRGSTLRIKHGALKLVSATGDGELLPKQTLLAALNQGAWSTVHHSIEGLTDKAMTLGTGAGPAKCERLA